MSLLVLSLLLAATVRAEPRRTEIVRGENGVAITTFVEGAGPPIVMLPSTGRDGGEDFDAVAADIARQGFTVLRPQPRGALGSWGR